MYWEKKRREGRNFATRYSSSRFGPQLIKAQAVDDLQNAVAYGSSVLHLPSRCMTECPNIELLLVSSSIAINSALLFWISSFCLFSARLQFKEANLYNWNFNFSVSNLSFSFHFKSLEFPITFIWLSVFIPFFIFLLEFLEKRVAKLRM